MDVTFKRVLLFFVILRLYCITNSSSVKCNFLGTKHQNVFLTDYINTLLLVQFGDHQSKPMFILVLLRTSHHA